MNALDAELALDRIDARLAAELPANIAASARAYADGVASPAAIVVSPREIDAIIASRGFAEHRARATRLLRVIVPMVIESAPAVIAACARERTWANWRVLAAARDEHARLRFGRPHRTLVHALAGVSRREPAVGSTDHSKAKTGVDTSNPALASANPGRDASLGARIVERERVIERVPPPIDGWTDTARNAVSDEAIQDVWSSLCGDEAVGALSIARSKAAHPRTFVVERGARAIIVVPARIDSLAARFAVLHELGHARLWLAPISRDHEWPRAIDEAAAAYVARTMEEAHESPEAARESDLAFAARSRRQVIARALDWIEAGGGTSGIETPPWAVWNDPHAQASYIEAERIADDLPAGRHGTMLEKLVERTEAIDANEW